MMQCIPRSGFPDKGRPRRGDRRYGRDSWRVRTYGLIGMAFFLGAWMTVAVVPDQEPDLKGFNGTYDADSIAAVVPGADATPAPVMRRDPFWPVGYEPPPEPVDGEPPPELVVDIEPVAPEIEPPDWEAAAKSLNFQGTFRARGRDLASVNGQIVEVGDMIGLRRAPWIYQWRITAIDLTGVATTPVEAIPAE